MHCRTNAVGFSIAFKHLTALRPYVLYSLFPFAIDFFKPVPKSLILNTELTHVASYPAVIRKLPLHFHLIGNCLVSIDSTLTGNKIIKDNWL